MSLSAAFTISRYRITRISQCHIDTARSPSQSADGTLSGGKMMEIKIGIGLDNIVFGMSQEDVNSIFGIPDKISETEKINGIVYYYN